MISVRVVCKLNLSLKLLIDNLSKSFLKPGIYITGIKNGQKNISENNRMRLQKQLIQNALRKNMREINGHECLMYGAYQYMTKNLHTCELDYIMEDA